MSSSAQQNWNKTYKVRNMVSTLDYAKNAFGKFQLKPRSSLLDIGCGDGRDALYFSAQGLQVTAIDFSEEAIGKIKKEYPHINALVLDILNMDFPDASFDVVFAHLSLHYFDDPKTDTVFHTIHRILKPKGLFFVRCKSIHDPLYGKGEEVGKDMFLLKHVRHFFSEEYMKEKLREFEICSLQQRVSDYDGKRSCFVEAVARKTTSSQK